MRAALFVTERCSLRCEYCYLSHKKPVDMTLETGLAALTFLARTKSGPSGITFFGGEPLLNFKLITQLVAQAETWPQPVRFSVSTNATELTVEHLQYFRQHNFHFYIGYYETHWGTLRQFPHALIRKHFPGVIMTRVTTRHNYRNTIPLLKEFIDAGHQNIIFSFNYNEAWTAAELDELTDVYREMASVYRELFNRHLPVYLNPIEDRIHTGIRRLDGPRKICDLANTQVAIDVSGKLYPCVQFVTNCPAGSEFELGDIYTGFNRNRPACVERNCSPRAQCANCDFNGRCTNWCGCTNWKNTGKIETVPQIVCEHDRRLIPVVDELANDLYAADPEYFLHRFYAVDYMLDRAVSQSLCPEATDAR